MKIVIFQPMLKFYRVPLFVKLHELLTADGHELRLVFGSPWEEEKNRKDNAVLQRDYCYYEKSHWLFKNKIHIQYNSIKHIIWADLVITEQANKHAYNYLLVALSALKIKPFAYWGHGLNRQASTHSFSELIKKRLARQVDWWFAYTSSVAEYIQQLGFPKEHISLLNNSVDTMSFVEDMERITSQDLAAFRQCYLLAADAQIGLFCGNLNKEKQLDLLLESALLIKENNPRFRLLIGGDGQDRARVEAFVTQHPFAVYLGPLYAERKCMAFKCADVLLNPGLVGLGILDGFAAGLPLLTTLQTGHGPEIDYLAPGHNGMYSAATPADYAGLVISTLSSPEELVRLKTQAQASSMQFSIENMAHNFSDGINRFAAYIQDKKTTHG
jgi:L-malate glycosyltransferase